MAASVVWIVGGVILGIAEIFTSGYILLGFAAGAILTGVLVAVGALPDYGGMTFLVFALLSLAAWLVVRRFWGPRSGDNTFWINRDINDQK
ncbi:hypothetical protein D2T29_12365 [Sinirhodobacter populi]|uniref:NfeD family protein n=2 Tax=Paenirhodobacter populi TaxID=2306993 RepID=A0A443KCL4_9RHOB|nr:hypothetical protein D2T29_12365 [Sinirhodobacter populi]